MNCQAITLILNDADVRKISFVERKKIDLHLASCSACGDAWYAQDLVASRPIPATPDDLLERIVCTVSRRSEQPTRVGRSWRIAVAGSAFTVGLAFATFIVLRPVEPPVDESIAFTEQATNAGSTLEQFLAQAESDLQAQLSGDQADSRLLPDGDFFPLLRIAPAYPSAAAIAGIEGDVLIEYRVTSAGSVADVTIVESSNSVFDAAAVEGALKFRYKPRVANGVPVDVLNVQGRMNFRLGAIDAANESEDANDYAPLVPVEEHATRPRISRPEFHTLIAPAIECVDRGELLCAQLVLDEALATYEFAPMEAYDIWRFYGFIHTERGNYEEAILAYETAIGQPRLPEFDSRLTLAYLYLERFQYQQALDMTLEYLARAHTEGRQVYLRDQAYLMLEQLRKLGITPIQR